METNRTKRIRALGARALPAFVRIAALVALLALLAGALAQEEEPDAPVPTEGSSLADVILARPDLSTLAEILEGSGLLEQLETIGVLTVFAPTDAAFEALGEERLAAIRSYPGALNFVLRHHMVNAAIPESALRRSPTFTSLQGVEIYVDAYGDAIRIGSARVVEPGLQADNGVVHVIDRLVLPHAHFPMKNQSSIPIGGATQGTGRATDP